MTIIGLFGRARLTGVRTDAKKRAIWGYASVVGTLHELIHARVPDERRAALMFFLAC